MKEVTEWNGKPRLMWVWDNDEKQKRRDYVVYILTKKEIEEVSASGLPVVTTDCKYEHCAEIEESTRRPCTREELIEMLKKQGMFLLKSRDGCIHTVISIAIESLNFVAIANDDYEYDKLCETFTLLDGTELWVEE